MLLLCWMIVANGQASDSRPKPAGAIAGSVTLEGKPAPGVQVVAVAGESVNRRDAAARSVADAEGRYRISGLAPGQYQIWTLTPGLIAESKTVPFLTYYGAQKSIILGAGEDIQDVDLRLIRGGVITGRVTNQDNQPIIGERIALLLLDANGQPRFGALSYNEQMAETDDRGIYRVFGLPPGRYKVSVGHDPAEGIRRSGRYEKTYYPETTDQAKASIIELKEAEEVKNIDIKAQPAAPTYSASGRVTDSETGLPMVRAGIRFVQITKDARSSGLSFGVQADDQGEFTFSGFAPGKYAVSASSEVYGGNFYGNPVYFEVVDKDIAGIELKTIPGLSLSGFVLGDGQSTRELLNQLPGLRVQARAITSTNEASSGGTSTIAPDGSFQIDGLRPGRVSISLYSVGALRPTITRIEHAGIGIDQGFDIQKSISDLRLVINYGTGAIRGTIKIEGDFPLSELRMFVNCRRDSARESVGVLVDARGHFLIRNLASGNYDVTVQVGSMNPARSFRPTQPQKQTVNVTNGAEAEVTFVVDLSSRPGGP